jgi:rhodanese-related sulfurtransferase
MPRLALSTVAAALLALLGVGEALAADAPAPARASARSSVAAQTPPGAVDAATARRLVADGVKVVDVRTPAEYAAGHVPGAVNIPYDEIGRRSAELGPAETPLVLYCHSGRRSGIAVRTLAEQGFTRLYDLGAYEKWVSSEPGK